MLWTYIVGAEERNDLNFPSPRSTVSFVTVQGMTQAGQGGNILSGLDCFRHLIGPAIENNTTMEIQDDQVQRQPVYRQRSLGMPNLRAAA